MQRVTLGNCVVWQYFVGPAEYQQFEILRARIVPRALDAASRIPLLRAAWPHALVEAEARAALSVATCCICIGIRDRVSELES